MPPGRTLVRKTSAVSASLRMTSRPSSVRASTTMDFLPRLSLSKAGLSVRCARGAPFVGKLERTGSPPGGSIFMTSAPQSDRIPPAPGAAKYVACSMTLMPLRSRAASRFYVLEARFSGQP